jgi:hypothetical protein
MKNFIAVLLIMLAFLTTASAQWSIGARFGGSSGVSLKNYPSSNGVLFEAISAFNFDESIDGFSLTLLGEKLGTFSNDGKLGAILGLGETMVFGNDFLFGVNGILGFDWRLGKIGLQLDWMPTYIFVNDSYFSSVNAAFTARWMFGGRRNQ